MIVDKSVHVVGVKSFVDDAGCVPSLRVVLSVSARKTKSHDKTDIDDVCVCKEPRLAKLQRHF